jgi:hypothetical protein
MKICKITRLLLTFYKNYFIFSFLITICCGQILRSNGIKVFILVFWFKILTLGIIYYFINGYKKNEFFYYQNLGISKIQLWVSSLIFDILLFISVLILIYKVK